MSPSPPLKNKPRQNNFIPYFSTSIVESLWEKFLFPMEEAKLTMLPKS